MRIYFSGFDGKYSVGDKYNSLEDYEGCFYIGIGNIQDVNLLNEFAAGFINPDITISSARKYLNA